MAKIIINKEKCKACYLCLDVCPKSLIKISDDLNKQGVKPAIFVDNNLCLGCAFCALICPDCCIEVFK